MLSTNPFAELSQTVPSIFLQFFVITMVLLIIIGTGLDMLHKKNVVYFFRNAQKAKKSAKTELSAGKKTAVILKTVASDIATTSELGFGKRRLAHVLGMYGTILFWIASVVLIFKYSDGVAARLETRIELELSLGGWGERGDRPKHNREPKRIAK